MSGALVYVVGPSGAGKDSVLQGLRAAWTGLPPAHWGLRTITRPAQAGGEVHESVDEAGFEVLLQAGALAMHWQANGLRYGLRCRELEPLAHGQTVLVNGSRAYLPTLVRRWPQACVVHITAPEAVLARRLLARRREDAGAVAARLARAVDHAWPADVITIVNDGPLEDAVRALRAALGERVAAQNQEV